MIGFTEIHLLDNTVIKRHRIPERCGREAHFFARLDGLNITPPLIEYSKNEIQMQRGAQLSPDNGSMGVAVKLLEKIIALHKMGICHRDIHMRNIILIDDDPRIIDFEYAIDITDKSTHKCYDLFGPRTGVPKPKEHRIRSHTETGVWWDTPMTSVTPLNAALPTLEEVLNASKCDIDGI